MIMEKAYKQQVFSKLCSNLSTPLPMILSLVLFSFFFFFSISKSFPFLLTIPIALLSTLFLVTLTKKKGSQDENLVHDKLQKEELQQSSLDVTHPVVICQQSETAESHEVQAEAQSYYSSPSDSESINFSVMDEIFELNAQEHEHHADSQSVSSLPSNSESNNFLVMDKTFELNDQEHEQQAGSQTVSSLPSDSESSNFLVMDKMFELNAQEHEQQADSHSDSSLPSDSESSTGSIMYEIFEIGHYGNQNVSCSDSLASDNDDDDEEEEDSLIEINLPNSHFSGFTEEPEQKMESKLPDFLPESIFKEQGLMELLAEINEMNEDENLIEIDISMGSINSQDFRLKQELAQLGDQCVLSE